MKHLTHRVERVDPREYSLESREVSEERNVARDVLVIFTLLAVVYALFAWLLPIAAEADAHPADHVRDNRYLPICAVEDASYGPVPCVWLANVVGNQKGHSFRVYRDGRVKYISDARAFELVGGCDSDGPLYCRTGS